MKMTNPSGFQALLQENSIEQEDILKANLTIVTYAVENYMQSRKYPKFKKINVQQKKQELY